MVSVWIVTDTSFFFFFNAPPTTEIYTLSLHDALPIWCGGMAEWSMAVVLKTTVPETVPGVRIPLPPPSFALDRDRKSTRLNSSHVSISYAVFCLKKKKTKTTYYYQLDQSKST